MGSCPPAAWVLMGACRTPQPRACRRGGEGAGSSKGGQVVLVGERRQAGGTTGPSGAAARAAADTSVPVMASRLPEA